MMKSITSDCLRRYIYSKDIGTFKDITYDNTQQYNNFNPFRSLVRWLVVFIRPGQPNTTVQTALNLKVEVDKVIPECYQSGVKIQKGGTYRTRKGHVYYFMVEYKPDVEEWRRNMETQNTCSETGGMKETAGKIRWDLIPWEVMDELARVYEYGDLNKYSPGNWRKGYEWFKSIRAIFSHATAWIRGEQYDGEAFERTGLKVHHLAMVAWHCFTLIHYEKYNKGFDDRMFKDMEREYNETNIQAKKD